MWVQDVVACLCDFVRVRACVRACVRGWVGGWVDGWVCVCAGAGVSAFGGRVIPYIRLH